MKQNDIPQDNTPKLPEGITLGRIEEDYRTAAQQYIKAHKRARVLDATDRGKLWSAVNAKFPSYQILPDSNHVSYIKNNILSSIYTVGKTANLIPTSKEDQEIVGQLNIALNHIWSRLNVVKLQMEAGERAALLNYGLTQVGWNNNIQSIVNKTKGEVVLKNVDPLRFMRDPFSTGLDNARFCLVWEDLHKSAILANPNYKEAFQKYLKNHSGTTPISQYIQEFDTDKLYTTGINEKGYYRVFTTWVRHDGKVHEIHSLGFDEVLLCREDIKPSMFPFAELYCNLPSGDLFGTSEPAKIFANSLAYNIMSSLIATSEYKNQRPQRFVNGQSMINVNAFTREGNDADKTWVVMGDASKAVHYHSYPQPTQAANTVMAAMGTDIKNLTGIDDRYTGRDTGSVITTGGVNSVLDQVTMIDAPKVINYEEYTKRLTELIVRNYLEHSAYKRSYFYKDKKSNNWKTAIVDFPNISADTVFNYEVAISSEMPKNKSRLESVANHLLEMQMQYQGQGVEVDIITPEEWLMFQDLPFKEFMQERMGIQRTTNWTEAVTQAVTQYATMVEQGVHPNDALEATAQTLAAQQQPGGDINQVADQMQAKQQMMGGGMPMM